MTLSTGTNVVGSAIGVAGTELVGDAAAVAGEVVSPGVVVVRDVAVVVGLALGAVVSPPALGAGSFEEQPARTVTARTAATSHGRRAALMR